MHGLRWGMWAAFVSGVAVVLSAHGAFAQDDPFADMDEGPMDDEAEAEPPADEGPMDEGPVDEGPVDEGPMDEGPMDEGPMDAEAEGGAEVSGGLSLEAGASTAAPTVAESSSGGEILVTGSRVKRTNYSLPSAVQVMTREELQASGHNTMADVVRTLNINYGSQTNADVSTGGAGTAQFNLRGLGLNSTLVLLNGRRIVNSGALSIDGQNFVDVNAIPIAMIERVEVLKGGASAIYGTDAVAGVVNIITNRTMEGFDVQAGVQATDKFDQHEWDVSLVAGETIGKTRLNAMLGYFRREPLDANDRDFTQAGPEGVGYNVSGFGNPGGWIQLQPNPTMDPLMPLIPAFNVDPATTPDFNPSSPAFWITSQDPGCPPAYGASPQYPNSSMTGTAAPPWGCRFNFGPFFNLVPDETRANLYFTADHDISDHTQIFMEGGYARSRTKRGVSPSFPALSPIIIPPDHVGNMTGAYLRWFGRPLGAGAGGDTQFFDSDTLHMVAGFGGDFGAVTDAPMVEDWTWEISGTYAVNRFDFGLHDALYDPLQEAINSCSMIDPTAANTGPDCFNPLTTGPQNSPEVIEKVIGELTSQTDTELTTVGLDFTGPIVELPGGDLALALGAQMRNEDVKRDNDHDANQESYLFLVGGKDFTADRQILAGYGELIIPMFTAFELQAAGRAENYSDAGSTINPKVGLSWTPYETFTEDTAPNPARVRVRGTFATSFRAPSLLQMYGSQTALENTYDPTSSDDPATPQVELPTTGTFIAVTTDGNPNLDPETSTAITAGLEWQPVDGMTVDGDYFLYDYQQLIAKQDHQQLVIAEYLAMMGNQVLRDPATGSIQRINALFQNEESVKTHGIDFNVIYASDFGSNAGTFSFGVNGTYLLGFEIPQSSVSDATLPDMDCDGTSCDVAGLRNNSNFAPPLPRLRATVPLGWEYDMHKVTVTPRFTSGYKNDTDIEMTTNAFADVDPWFTLDLQYRIRIEETDDMATSITLGCQNVTGATPPAVPDGFGYDAQVHDPRGRLLYAKLLQEF